MSDVLESPLSAVVEERKNTTVLEQTMIPAISELVPQIDSREQINMSLITTDAKELYQELQQMRYSIVMAFENTQIVSDIVDTKRRLVS